MTEAASSARRTPTRLRTLPSRLLGLAGMWSDRRVTDGLAAIGAHKWHYAVLAALQEYGPASQAALSDRSGIHRSDMVAAINELAAEEYVARAPDPADRRRNVITITPRGRRRLTRIDALLTDLQDDVLAPLSAAERTELTRMLGLLVAHHGDAM
ncbi:MarR family winged helix-turn-helix transcriptional regulator [Streptomyces sp. NRRL F-5123]|uniref:MarR family winged helix-turn-helix transcriptional regulator n=1 Tax=Streptomyces sp. NRRL F-5123 TaxID=1463856 RepID=UPI0004E1650B|nr:MarR family transcriptional regulator [Streptomyces sp. NRRL F-5123]